jgi:predicted nucleic acid-binding protein
MKYLKKLNFVVLPLAIWAITVIYVLLNKFIGTFTQNMEPSPEQENALDRSGLGDLLKNAEPMKSIGIDSQYTVPIIHYEILFSLYSNTRLATADERKQKFLENQIVNLVEDCSADEIAPTYARLVSELQRGDYKLLDTWKKQQYQKAISILQE